jgi:hypothetical protein
VADDIDYVMIIICRHGGVGSQTGHRVEPYWQSSVEINLSTCSADKHCCKPLQLQVNFARWVVEFIGVWLSILQIAVTFGRIKGLLYLVR